MKKKPSVAKDMQRHISSEKKHIKRDRKEFGEIVKEDEKMLSKMKKKC